MTKINKKKETNFSLGWSKTKSEIKKNKVMVSLMFFLSMLIFISSALYPLLIGKAINAIIHPETFNFFSYSINAFYFFLILVTIIKIVEMILDTYLYRFLLKKFANTIYVKYTKEVFSKILSFPASFFKNNSLGSITYSANTGTEKLRNIFYEMQDMIGFPILIALNTIFLFFISKEIFIIILILNIILVTQFFLSKEKRKKVADNLNTEKKNISKIITENINHSIEVKKNSSEEKENSFLSKTFRTSYNDKFLKEVYFNFKYTLFNDIISISLYTVMWFYIYILFRDGSINEGDIVSISMYSMMITRNLYYFLKFINNFIEHFTILGDTEKLLSNNTSEINNGIIKDKIKGQIEFKNINFEYYEQEEKNKKENLKKDFKKFSLKDINIKIEKGQKVAFVGESGGGKTTLIEMIGQFIIPNSGDILIDNIKTSEWDLKHLRKNIAYVSQDVAIFNSTIKKNIAYGVDRDVSDEEIKEAAMLANMDGFIKDLKDGYDTSVGEKGLKLSGGQKQRISIARAILRDPKILILDEPTSALDIVSEKHITKSLEKLMQNRTTIIIAHRLSTVMDADNIFVIEKGQVIEKGTYNELISKNGKFKEMVELNNGLE